MLGHIDSGTGLHRLEGLAGEQAVVTDDVGGEVDTVVGHVGHVAGDEVGDEFDHLIDIGRGMGIGGGAHDTDGVHGPPPH